ncbi:MAG: NAD(P)-dependent oxidoreductase [Alphaproteobacteria bacterium]|jgi:UDP-glucose 4-epimerase|nr:NAD(P)-dependent oxidoreductase [Alphaproteobacteria bacterium]MBP9776969.1 NAD(P)-dependent oxidoreductase [Alphaproteobacteria bacterium]
MKILITGSEGLIGTAIFERLKKLNIDTIHFDKKFPLKHPYYGDILNKDKLEAAVADCDGIVHLAAVSRVIWGEKNPELCWKTNYEGTCSVVESALLSPKKPWILYASSREVYGKPPVLPAIEETPYNAINIYGESKIEAEKAILGAREKGLQTAIVRYSNVYGSLNDHHDRVIPAFCKAAATGSPIRVDGFSNTFDFTYIDDVVEGTLKIVSLLCEGKNPLPPFHLTTGQETSLREAAELANQIGKKQSEIIEAPSRQYDVPNFCGDSTKTRNILGWNPKVGIEEGIERLTKLFQK